MASTAIPAVKAAIMAALEGAVGLDDVMITDDKEPERAKEYVWLYEAQAERDWKTIGPQPVPLKENVTVELRVFVSKGTDKQKPSEERAFEIAEAVENALRDDPDLNGTLLHQRVEKLRQQQLVPDQRRTSHVLMTVSGEARI
jgi:hypothetical protein